MMQGKVGDYNVIVMIIVLKHLPLEREIQETREGCAVPNRL